MNVEREIDKDEGQKGDERGVDGRWKGKRRGMEREYERMERENKGDE